MIYTIGYGNDLTPDMLVAQMRGRGITTLVDVRSKPYSQHRPEFNRESIKAAVCRANLAYSWQGDRLGGFSKIEDRTIASLAEWGKAENILIMCAERDFVKCHRHTEIARRLSAMTGVSVVHITKDNKEVPAEIQASLF